MNDITLSVRIERDKSGKGYLTVRDDRGEKLPCVRGATLSQEAGEVSILTLQFVVDGKRVTLEDGPA